MERAWGNRRVLRGTKDPVARHSRRRTLRFPPMKTTSQNGAEFIAGTEAAKDTSQPVLTDESAYLRLLGESVRSARARRGMTRKMLATHSGVSERFLAQLESGAGNASILILRQIAQALDLPLDAMLSNGSGAPAELADRKSVV